jgi:hypothetical protein
LGSSTITRTIELIFCVLFAYALRQTSQLKQQQHTHHTTGGGVFATNAVHGNNHSSPNATHNQGPVTPHNGPTHYHPNDSISGHWGPHAAPLQQQQTAATTTCT